MNPDNFILRACVAALVAHSMSAFAQSGETRAEVKAETREAVKEGKLPVADDGSTPAQRTPAKFASGADRSRKSRKSSMPGKPVSAAASSASH